MVVGLLLVPFPDPAEGLACVHDAKAVDLPTALHFYHGRQLYRQAIRIIDSIRFWRCLLSLISPWTGTLFGGPLEFVLSRFGLDRGGD